MRAFLLALLLLLASTVPDCLHADALKHQPARIRGKCR
jgi:hypothetical protein